MTNRRRSSQRRRTLKRRSLRPERLEARQLMAGDIGLHNAQLPADVNVDGRVSSLDALVVVNHLTRSAAAEGESIARSSTPQLVDVDNNGSVTARDALIVINELVVEAEVVPADTGRPGPLMFDTIPKGPEVNAAAGLTDAEAAQQVNVDLLNNFKTLNPAFTEYVAEFNDAHRRGIDPDNPELGSTNEIKKDEVETLLNRASAATRSDDAIIAVVDRNGTILGVRVEDGVSESLKNNQRALGFAIDGAVAKARTAAFFSNNAAPITSRTIRSLSQSTMAQRVVESSPVPDALQREGTPITGDAVDRYLGPGFVAPIGAGGKFPPEVNFTPQVDLFGIEHQSRDSQRHPGANGLKGDTDDFYLRTRFNADPEFIPRNAERFSQTWPEAYNIQIDHSFEATGRGVATLPGGVPLYKLVTDFDDPTPVLLKGAPPSESVNLVGGIGVFFPGENGFATHEQGFKHGVDQTEKARTNAEKVLEAEFSAVVAAAGTGSLFNPFQSAFRRDLSEFNDNLPPLPNFALPTGRIDLVGITLEIFGPNPDRSFRKPGIDRLIKVGRENFGGAGFVSGELQKVNQAGDLTLDGQPVPEGWLVAPQDSEVSDLTAEDVDQIIANGVVEAQRTRAAIRLDLDAGFRPGARTAMVLSVADTNGELLGVYRMPDATIFSIDVSIAKARNTAYYADPGFLPNGDRILQDEDRIDFDGDGVFENISQSLDDRTGDTLPYGTALTNRSFRFIVEPRFPSGIEIGPVDGLMNDPNLDLCDQRPDICKQVAPQSIMRMPGINPFNAENLVDDQPLPASVYGSDDNTFSVLAFDAFNPSRNFRDPGDAGVKINGTNIDEPLANQNGIVFFPGSTPLYANPENQILSGGFGVSGDGVDQDDVVTVAGQQGFAPPQEIRVDSYVVGGVRLPFQKFNRSPFTP